MYERDTDGLHVQVYLPAMKSYVRQYDQAPPATYEKRCDGSKSDFARCALACCSAAKVEWC